MLDMRQFDYFFQKRLGYFGFRYMRYLEENHPRAYDRLASTPEAAKVFVDINAYCQWHMQNVMEMLQDGKRTLNKHKPQGELAKQIYYYMVETAKNRCLRIVWRC